ncbi:Ankyrin repeat domain-containing protein 49 [Nymphon striatum]|nr:Ankyrin repeat domain-containing protein 49 [Nymphon striatum]
MSDDLPLTLSDNSCKNPEDRMFVSAWDEGEDEEEDEVACEKTTVINYSSDILSAAGNNGIERIAELLKIDASLVNSIDTDGYTPLHRACYTKNSEIVKLLLEKGANVAAKTTDGWQPLHSACKWDSVKCASLLIENDANINARTNGNQTPLHLAASNGKGRNTLELLLWQKNIDTNVLNNSGDTAFDIARRIMSVWQKVQRLPRELLTQLNALYDKRFPIEVRHCLAVYIEEQVQWDAIDPDNTANEVYAAGILKSMIEQIEKISTSNAPNDPMHGFMNLKLNEAISILREIKDSIPGILRRVRNTRQSSKAHPFQVALPNSRTLSHNSSFIRYHSRNASAVA